MIHDHDYVRKFLWLNAFRNTSYQDSSYLIPYSIAVILLVYVTCTVIKLARQRDFKTLSRGRLS